MRLLVDGIIEGDKLYEASVVDTEKYIYCYFTTFLVVDWLLRLVVPLRHWGGTEEPFPDSRNSKKNDSATQRQ